MLFVYSHVGLQADRKSVALLFYGFNRSHLLYSRSKRSFPGHLHLLSTLFPKQTLLEWLCISFSYLLQTFIVNLVPFLEHCLS